MVVENCKFFTYEEIEGCPSTGIFDFLVNKVWQVKFDMPEETYASNDGQIVEKYHSETVDFFLMRAGTYTNKTIFNFEPFALNVVEPDR